MLHRLTLALLCAFGCVLTLSPSAAAQDLFFNTEIVSLELSGTGILPLGPGGSMIATTINLNKSQDHNSSRSNKTNTIAEPDDPDDTDDVDPFDVNINGRPFDLFSSVDLQFELAFTDVDPTANFAPSIIGNPIALSELDKPLDLVGQPSSFTFTALEPDFSMLLGNGTRSFTYRGHVTVLKVAFGGGGGDIELDIDGVEMVVTPSTEVIPKSLGGGLYRYTSDVTLSMTGTYAGEEFIISDFSGQMVEEGGLVNNVVPEPSSVLLAVGGLALVAAARRRRV